MSIDASDILKVTKSVTKEWEKQRKAEEKGNRSKRSRAYMYSDRVNFTDVANRILPDAYQHASGNGELPVSKRQLYYASRDKFYEATSREISYGYFGGKFLVQYMNRHAATDEWMVTADPRGTLKLPNTRDDVEVPCGTLAIDEHLEIASKEVDPYALELLPTDWPSLAGGQRYQGVLYIEKEGFGPLFEHSGILERYSLALLSSKGQSVVAARRFVDEVCGGLGIPLLVVHDLDKAGFEISQRLVRPSDAAIINDRVTYEFKHEIEAIDLGLRLPDVEEYGLVDEYVKFDGHFASDSICTDEEKKYLRSNRRVELNAFTSPQFIEWLDARLSEHLTPCFVPEDDDTIEQAFRRAVMLAHINTELAALKDVAKKKAKEAGIPDDLRERLQTMLQRAHGADDCIPWDRALYQYVLGKGKVYRWNLIFDE